ncbi:hypothetical protein J6590_072199 [Homalodisca vitripennis]|nr:hypothetical protein J6590_072199 [Homalodisca vitripennis]
MLPESSVKSAKDQEKYIGKWRPYLEFDRKCLLLLADAGLRLNWSLEGQVQLRRYLLLRYLIRSYYGTSFALTTVPHSLLLRYLIRSYYGISFALTTAPHSLLLRYLIRSYYGTSFALTTVPHSLLLRYLIRSYYGISFALTTVPHSLLLRYLIRSYYGTSFALTTVPHSLLLRYLIRSYYGTSFALTTFAIANCMSEDIPKQLSGKFHIVVPGLSGVEQLRQELSRTVLASL